MHIYFSGIGGVAIGPLAMLAKDAGYTVSGSDREQTLMTQKLAVMGIPVQIGQNGEEIAKAHAIQPIDWVVHSVAVKPDNPELVFAREHNIRISKRHELINQIMGDKQLQMVAISGTHGKTTTTGMVMWLFQQLGIPVSYAIGTNISFGPAAQYTPDSRYFVYEADEFDRNMLQFKPHLSLIPSISYDHPDTYPEPKDYHNAFRQFVAQSGHTILWERDAETLALQPAANLTILSDDAPEQQEVKLPGVHTRANAWLAIQGIHQLVPEHEITELVNSIGTFPGTERRFERLAPNLYTDYAHHPNEIAATLQMARELSDDIVVVYQPHQNIRQHEIQTAYKNCFNGARKVYWLPTYLSREDESLPLLTPTQLIAQLTDPSIVQPAEFNETLVETIQHARQQGALVLFMSAGELDQWARDHLAELV